MHWTLLRIILLKMLNVKVWFLFWSLITEQLKILIWILEDSELG